MRNVKCQDDFFLWKWSRISFDLSRCALENFLELSCPFMSSFFLIFRDSSKIRRFILVNQWYAAPSFSLSRLSPGRINCISLPRKVAAKSEVTVKILISPALFRGAAVYLGYSPLSGFMVLYTLCFIFYSVHTLSLARSSPPRRDCMRNAPLVSPRERRYYAVGVLAPVLRTRTTLVPRFFSISFSLCLFLFNLA